MSAPRVDPLAWVTATNAITEARVVLNGLAYDDLVRAVEDARPWVLLPDGLREGEQHGKRVRAVSRQNRDVLVAGVVHMVTNDARVYLRDLALTMPSRDWDWFIHPDDVPDPDADLIERMAKAMYATDAARDGFPLEWDAAEESRDLYREAARAALAVARERGAL